MRNFLIILFSIFCITIALGQEKKKEKQYNLLQNEIGIDFQNFFRSSPSTLGGSLIYKRRMGEKTYISLNEKKSWRFQVGGEVDKKVGTDSLSISNTQNWDWSNWYEIQSIVKDRFQINALVGFEWQKQVNRFQYFYGIDLGFSYGQGEDLASMSWNGTGLLSYTVRDETISMASIIGFGGIKYFFTERISLSLESSLDFRYKILDRNLTDYFVQDNTTNEIDSGKRTEININFDYLRTLNLSYYF